MPRLTLSILALLLLAAGVAWWLGGGSKPEATGDLADLSADVVPLLRQLPSVARVEARVRPARPTCRIVHFRDWHALDEATDAKLAAEVETVQGEQLQALGQLAGHHGLARVGSEGLTAGDMPRWLAALDVLREVDREQIPALQALLAKVPDAEALAMIHQHQARLRELGAAGRLLLAGKIEAVDPIEEAEALEAARPRDGLIDPARQRARDDAIVRVVTSRGPLAVLVLGAAHDLSDSVRRLAPGCEYIAVTTSTVGRLARQ